MHQSTADSTQLGPQNASKYSKCNSTRSKKCIKVQRCWETHLELKKYVTVPSLSKSTKGNSKLVESGLQQNLAAYGKGNRRASVKYFTGLSTVSLTNLWSSAVSVSLVERSLRMHARSVFHCSSCKHSSSSYLIRVAQLMGFTTNLHRNSPCRSTDELRDIYFTPQWREHSPPAALARQAPGATAPAAEPPAGGRVQSQR